MSKARTSSQAIKRYRTPLQRALACLTKSDIWLTGRPPGDEIYRLAIAGGAPVILNRGSGRSHLYFDASQRFDLRHDGTEFRVSTKGYIYTLSESEHLESEVVSWHWHPPARSRPHLHLSDRSLGHIPTGRVTFEAVVRYAIEDLGVTAARTDWDDILLSTEALHVKYRSWSVDPDVDPH